MDRDCAERGRTVAQVLEQYHQTVRPMHLQYVEPSKLVADIIVHSTSDTSPTLSSSTDDKSNDVDTSSTPKSHGSLDVACEVLKNHLMMVANLSLDKIQEYNMEEAVKQMKNIASLSSPSTEIL